MFDPADWETRNTAMVQVLRWFDADHLTGMPYNVAVVIRATAHEMARALPDSPELTAGLRKLLEAKDCFVRAAVDA